MGLITQQIRCVCHLSSASFPLRIPCLNTPLQFRLSQFMPVRAIDRLPPLSAALIPPLFNPSPNSYTEKNQLDFEQTGCDQTVVFLSMTTAGAETGVGAMCKVKINMKFGLCSEDRI